jgi:hypothetical protein
MDNVTPIRAPSVTDLGTAKSRRARLRRPKKGLLLRDSDDTDGFTTLDLVNGLQAVCEALDGSAGTADTDFVCGLAMAAKVLSSMVADRVEI